MNHRALSGLLILWLMLLTSGCGSDSPTNSGPARDYPVYFYSPQAARYYEYHPQTNLLDSFSLSVIPGKSMNVSADGRTLWIARDDTVYIADLASKTVVHAIPFRAAGQIAFSPDNQYAALMRKHLTIVRTSDYQVVLLDTGTTQYGQYWASGQFSFDGRYYYGITGGEYALAFFAAIVDIADGFSISHDSLPDPYPRDIPMTADNRHWLVSMDMSWNVARFRMVERNSGDVSCEAFFEPGPIRMQESRGGRFTYLSGGGNYLAMSSPPFTLVIYDRLKNSLTDTLMVAFSMSGRDYSHYPLDKFVVTPNDIWLVGSAFIFPRWLFVCNLNNTSAARVLDLGDRDILFLTCQMFE